MFKNRNLQVKLVKDATPTDTDPVADYMACLHSTGIEVDRLVDKTTKSAIKVIVVLTACQIATHIVKTIVD